jgi:hypothetical protein
MLHPSRCTLIRVLIRSRAADLRAGSFATPRPGQWLHGPGGAATCIRLPRRKPRKSRNPVRTLIGTLRGTVIPHIPAVGSKSSVPPDSPPQTHPPPPGSRCCSSGCRRCSCCDSRTAGSCRCCSTSRPAGRGCCNRTPSAAGAANIAGRHVPRWLTTRAPPRALSVFPRDQRGFAPLDSPGKGKAESC